MSTTNTLASITPFEAGSALGKGQSEGLGDFFQVFEKAAEYFALLSEPSRLRIIQAICHEERSVQEVVEHTGLPQPNVSRHLALLHRSGVLSRRRSGTSVFYRVSDPTITELCRLVCVRMSSE
jgi:DNA-binding transcriptional ArsR family regulator